MLCADAGRAAALDLANLANNVTACADFDRHVNGEWHSAASIPPHKARIGSFDDLRDQSRRIVEQALADAVKAPEQLDTPGKRLAADYYASGIDLAQRPRILITNTVRHEKSLTAV